jgi:hypothetical protein
MQLTPEEAQQALREIEGSRLAFRRAIRASKGYQHLWLWGGIWVLYAMTLQFPALAGPRAVVTRSIGLVGFLGSGLIGWRQRQMVRKPIDRRFLAALAMMIGFGVFVWPTLLGNAHGHALFAYPALLAMQAYILAGIWYDNHLVWVGLLTTVLLLFGLIYVSAYFWWWAAVFGGGTLILSGFYVRHSWR